MKVSLAMTTFNGERYLINQLDTIRCQSRSPDEVIICDDGSTDKTIEIIENYIKKYELDTWSFHKNPKNLGFSQNFKQAISMTTGDVVFLCDQDDEWSTDKIEKMLTVYHDHKNIAALMCNLIYIDQNSEEFVPEKLPGWYQRMQSYRPGSLNTVDFISLCMTNFAPGCVMSFTAKENGLYYYNEPLIRYRLHGNNAIGNSSATKSSNAAEQIERLERLKVRHQMALQTSYPDQEALRNNIDYIDNRISFYKKRSFSGLRKVWQSSKKTKRLYHNIKKTNIKDFLYYLHLMF